VFFATGIWHGASWNFVFWGMFHGTFLVIERMGLGKLLASLWRPLRHAYTLLVVMVGWVFFRADDFTHAIEYLKVMFGAGELRGTVNTFATNNINGLFYMALTLALLANLTVFHKIRTKLYATGLGPSLDTTGPAKLTLSASLYTTMLVVAFGVAMLFVSADTYNPFIYFRF
jgi:alginate O-acetyltransferase complex protein AlgI